MSNKISDFYGKVSKCHCTNSDPAKPMGCSECFSRGYVAECLHCLGKGQVEEPVAGGNGKMFATCPSCGGRGKFGVNKPSDWDTLHPPVIEEVPAPEQELVAAV